MRDNEHSPINRPGQDVDQTRRSRLQTGGLEDPSLLQHTQTAATRGQLRNAELPSPEQAIFHQAVNLLTLDRFEEL